MVNTGRTTSTARRKALACAAGCLLLAASPAGARSTSEASTPGETAPPAPAQAFAAPIRDVPAHQARLRLAAAARQHGDNSLALVEPLLDLATAEARAGEFSAAAGDFAEAVRLVETLRGAMDRRLLEPLRGLGLSAHAAGDYPRAAEALERAVHVMRIHHGLYHLGQLELLDALSRSYIELGQREDAELRQRAALQLVEREYGPESVLIVPAISALAEWYHGQGRLLEEREQLERKLDLLETAHGAHAPELVEPLRALALSYRLDYSPLPEGKRALKRALEIHTRHPGDITGRAETLVALGDWYLVFRERVRAFDTYAEAYALLAADRGASARIDELFGSPVPLLFPRPRPPEIDPNAAAGDVAEGFVLVEYGVNPLGRVVDVELIDSDPPGLMDHRVVQALRGARFRPKIADGEPVQASGLRLRDTFAFNARRRAERAAAPDP